MLERQSSAQAITLPSGVGDVESLAIGADGGIYLDQADRPMEIVRFAPQGGRACGLSTEPAPRKRSEPETSTD